MTGNRLAWLRDGYVKFIVAGIYGLAICLLMGRGAYDVMLGITAIGLIWQGLAGRRRFYGDAALKGLIAAGSVLFIQGFMAANGPVGKSPYVILWFLLATFGILQLPWQRESWWRHAIAIKVLLIAFVAMHLLFDVYRTVWNNEGKSGMYANMHFMSQYAVLTLPILAFMARYSRSSVRVILVLAMLGDIWLLLASLSRPGYLAALAAAMAVIPFVAPWLRWKLAAILLLVLGVLYGGDISGFSTRINDLAANFFRDERWTIWQEAIRLQERSTGLQWLFGHGLGRFVYDYKVVADLHRIELFIGPHNFFMEILYSHGLSGLMLVVSLYGWFLHRLVEVTRRQAAGIAKAFGILLVAMATAHLVHGFFTIPFFSRDYLLPFSFILSGGFLYFDRCGKAA